MFAFENLETLMKEADRFRFLDTVLSSRIYDNVITLYDCALIIH
jgi:hypothetical protein